MSKGRDAEKELAEYYQQAGYETYIPPLAKYREQDVFGLFDVLAFGHGRLEAVQVKAGRDAAGINEWFEQASVFEEHIDDLRVSFAHRTDGAWRVARTAHNGYEWVYDGRDPETFDTELNEVLMQ